MTLIVVIIIVWIACVAYVAGVLTGLSTGSDPTDGWDEAFARLEREQEARR